MLLPGGIPSNETMKKANAEPPTIEGVIAEPNSHSIIISKLCLHDSCLSDNNLIRYIYIRSLMAVNNNAINKQRVEAQVQFLIIDFMILVCFSIL